jgi:hypothetical protein
MSEQDAQDASTPKSATPPNAPPPPGGDDPAAAPEPEARVDEPAPAAEPIEAEFEPADSVVRQVLDRQVSMPIALGLAAAAAVLGGVFGVVFDGGGANRAQVERLVDSRLEAFDARQQELLEALAQSGSEGGGVAAAALAGLENELASAQASLEDLGNRLRVVEASRGNGDAAQALADQLSALEAQVAEARTLARQAASQTDAVAALDAEVTTLAETVRSQGRSIDQIASASSALAGRVTGAPAPANLAAAGAAAALAFASLEEAALSGGPFATEVADAQVYFPESEDLQALAALAETGAPTPVELAARFRSAAQAARDAEQPAGGGLVDRLGQAIAGLVTVRRLDAPETDSVGDVIVRAQRRLQNEDLAGAADELDRLTGAPRAAVAVWIDEARARVEIDARINALRASIAER